MMIRELKRTKRKCVLLVSALASMVWPLPSIVTVIEYIVSILKKPVCVQSAVSV